ncbi:hypothetical protein LSTR_LSTR007681 [Laodelphax striatellus]|uniref:Uncharacterized protein n=1 Tax=Laodelphax striatellus TaxID=195883 RepID=A0A482WJC8_LAOST|nr:hypothetical protein LSTR_LSTR007681 [Laodelphax striatellus]
MSSTDLKIIDNTTKTSDDGLMKNVDVASGAPKILPLFHCESFSEIDDEQAKLCESLLKCHEIFPPDEQSLSFFGDSNVKKTRNVSCSKSNSNSLTIEKSYDRCTKRVKSLSNSVNNDIFKNLKSKTQSSKTRNKNVKNVCSKSTGIIDAGCKTTIAGSVEQLTTEAIACNAEPNVMRSKSRVSHCRKSLDIVEKNVETLVKNTVSVNKFNRYPSKNDSLGRYKSPSVGGDKNTTPLGCASC